MTQLSDLIALITATIYTNGTNAIEAVNHNSMLDSLVTDLWSRATSDTYANLEIERAASRLRPGHSYIVSDFATIYDQVETGAVKTAATEPLLIIATSVNTFSPIAFSALFPNDRIIYDFTISTTAAATTIKGQILSRTDEIGRTANYDWRKMLFPRWETAPASGIFTVFTDNGGAMQESLTFDSGSTTEFIDFTSSTLFATALSIEFPNVIFSDDVTSLRNCIIQTANIGAVTQLIGSTIAVSTLASVTNCVNLSVQVSTVGGDFINSANMELNEVDVVGNIDNCSNCILGESTFGDNIQKGIAFTASESTFGGLVDRINEAALLTANIGGEFRFCSNLIIVNSDIDVDVDGLNKLRIVNTTCNCSMYMIDGINQDGFNYGFSDCTITGTSSTSFLGNIRLNCYVDTKTISEALYPELFDLAYTKTIYTKPNGEFWYTWLDNSNVAQFTQIV